MRVGNTLTIVCRSVIRSFDVPSYLSTDHQLQVHRKLVSFVSGFKPEHQIFAQVSLQLEMITFLDLGWVFIGYLLLDANSCPPIVVRSLKGCRVEDRTLSGFLRPETAKPPRAETSPPVTAAAAGLRPPRAPPPPPTIRGAGPASLEEDPNDSRAQGELILRGSSLLAGSSCGEEAQYAAHDYGPLSSLTGEQNLALVRQHCNWQTLARRHRRQRWQ